MHDDIVATLLYYALFLLFVAVAQLPSYTSLIGVFKHVMGIAYNKTVTPKSNQKARHGRFRALSRT